MTELTFTQTSLGWESQALQPNGNFTLELAYSEAERKGNSITLLRSLSGEQYDVAYSRDSDNGYLCIPVVNVLSDGCYIKIRSKKQPTAGAISVEE